MESFREFFEQQDFVEFVINEFDGTSTLQTGNKPWSAKKPEILNMWRTLRPDQPIYMTPMTKKATGGNQSYGEDGVRITGSWNFISAVLGRIKEIMAYENPNSKLRLVLRGVDKSKGDPSKVSYVFYVNMENRSKGKSGRPSIPKPTL